MSNIKKILEESIAEMNSIKKMQSDLIDILASKQVNALLGVDSDDTSIVDGLSDTFKLKIASQGDETIYLLQKKLAKSYKTILGISVELNSQLGNPFESLNKLKLAREKDILTTEDVELLYSFSKSQQANYRARLKDSLPYYKDDSKSKSTNAKILYNKKDIEKWFENNFERVK